MPEFKKILWKEKDIKLMINNKNKYKTLKNKSWRIIWCDNIHRLFISWGKKRIKI